MAVGEKERLGTCAGEEKKRESPKGTISEQCCLLDPLCLRSHSSAINSGKGSLNSINTATRRIRSGLILWNK